MKHRVELKILPDVINPWSRVDRNAPFSLWEKIHECVRKVGVPSPLIRDTLRKMAYYACTIRDGNHNSTIYTNSVQPINSITRRQMLAMKGMG